MIFVSHSSVDNQVTRRLVFELRRLHVPTWLDEFNLIAGSRVYDEIDESIKNAKAVLFILSEQALASNYVKDEIRLAERFAKQVITVKEPKLPLAKIPSYLQEYKIYEVTENTNYRTIAHEIANTYTDKSSALSNIELWIHDPSLNDSEDLQIDFNVENLGELVDKSYSIRLFDAQFSDLSERSSAVYSIDLSWLNDSLSYEEAYRRQSKLSFWVDNAITYIRGFINLYSISKRGDFEQHLLKGFLSSILKSIRFEIETVEYYANPTNEAAQVLAGSDRRGSHPKLFNGEELIQVLVNETLLGSLYAPPYVEAIDLPPIPGGIPGHTVLLKHELGAATGWLLGSQLWIHIKRESELSLIFPSPQQIKVGPA